MENNKVQRKCYAKINLYLSVNDKRVDGYHNIQTIFQTIDLHDNLLIEKTKSGIEINKLDDIDNEDRLEIKVTKDFFSVLGIREYGIKINVEKHIPIKAGLGGGSSDAGNVLVGLNELYGNPLTKEELCNIGIKHGSDIPFFIYNGCAYGKSRGEELEILKSNDFYVLIVLPNTNKVSTKYAYDKFDELMSGDEKDLKHIIKAINNGNVDYLVKNVYNCFECIYKDNDEFQKTLHILKQTNPLACTLCGSGTSLFGLYKTLEDVNKARKVLSNYYCITSKTIGG